MWQCWVCLFLTHLITMLIMSFFYSTRMLLTRWAFSFFENNFMALISWKLTTICRGGREPTSLITLVLDCVLYILSCGTNSTIHFKKTSPNGIWGSESLSVLLLPYETIKARCMFYSSLSSLQFLTAWSEYHQYLKKIFNDQMNEWL